MPAADDDDVVVCCVMQAAYVDKLLDRLGLAHAADTLVSQHSSAYTVAHLFACLYRELR